MKTGRFRAFAEEVVASLERGRYFYLITFSILFLAMTSLRALAKPLWFDELFTYYMSRLPDVSTMWAAAKAGADQCPPLMYIATRMAQNAFGDGLIATRLPAMLGFLAMLLCLYRFVAFRCGASYGFAAMLFAALSGAYAYAYEARSYGMVLGFSGLSMIAWQSAAAGRGRRFALPGLFLGITAALLTHGYAMLILIPLTLGELVRTLQRKRIDWPVWAALAAASCAVLAYVPLLASTRGFAVDNVTFRPSLRVLGECYTLLAAPFAMPLIAALVILTLFRTESASADVTAAPNSGLPIHELVLAGGFFLVPLYAYLMAKFVSHIFLPRYGLAAVIGCSILFACFAHRSAERQSFTGWAISVLFAVWFLSGFAIWMNGAIHSTAAAASGPGLVHSYEIPPELVGTDLPFVASSGLFFLEADHYAPPSFVSRLVYLADPEAAARYTGADGYDRGFPILQKWFPIRARVENYASFVRSHQRFLVFGGFDYPLGWVTKKLIDDGAELRFLGQYHGPHGENLLLEATMPAVEPALPPHR